MNSEEFPSLQEATNNTTEKSTLGASWAEVAQSDATSQEDSIQKDSIKEDGSLMNEQDASYANIAGHEKKLSEEYPSLQESVPDSEPTSSGVGDLINHEESKETVSDPSQPPNPDKSFADATANKGYPLPESTESTKSDLPPLSDLPDIKDMLNEPSVHVPPPPQSFAKIAAKEVPPETRSSSERTEVKEEKDPYAVNDDNFPTLGQSNLMATHNANEDEREVYTEISRLNQAADVTEDDDMVMVNNTEDETKKSFADVTASNMENAPPSATSRINQHPVYDENTVLLDKSKREKRKENAVEYGNNNELVEQEEVQEKKKEENKEVKKEEEKKKEKREVKDRSMNEVSGDAYEARLQVFDKTHSGRITIFDSVFALYRLGYPLLTIIPASFLMHIRLSTLSSPYGFPFIYRSVFDLISLPIYTKNLGYALTYKTPMLSQPIEGVLKMVKEYGSEEKGLGYWDGMRAISHLERLRWWQLNRWVVHRIQWTLTYTMLHDPSNHLVTTPTLISLNRHQ